MLYKRFPLIFDKKIISPKIPRTYLESSCIYKCFRFRSRVGDMRSEVHTCVSTLKVYRDDLPLRMCR